MAKEYIRLKGRARGYIDTKKKAYISHRTFEHQFHKFGEGFGCSAKILNFLREKGIESIEIIFNSYRLLSKVQDFYDYGERYSNNGDKQFILNLDKFTKAGKVEEKQVQLIY